MVMLGLTIERADEHGALVVMAVPDGLMSPFGTVHGGAIATLFDTALAVAITRHLQPTDRVATHNLNVSYVTFATEQRLLCHARVVSLRTAVAIAEGEVLTDAGTLVAKAVGTFGLRRKATR
jgi:acyl-CoA thioesterase